MNMTMPISHRLFASAVADGAAARRPAGKSHPAVIEVESVARRAPRQGAVTARAGELELSFLRARARKYL